MIKLLKLLIWGHVHKWETRSEVRLKYDGAWVGKRVYVVCETCGKHKKLDLL